MAERIARETADSFMPNQYFNEANPLIHYRTTGPEIWRQTGGKVDVLVAGMGTGGTISGAGRYLKERNPDVKLVGVDPKGSRYQAEFTGSGATAETQPYLLEGVGQDFIPGTLALGLLHEVIEVEDRDAFAMARRMALEEGILAGGSAGAAVAAALRLASSWARGQAHRRGAARTTAAITCAASIPTSGCATRASWTASRKGVPVREILAAKPFRFRQLQSLHPDDSVRKAITMLMANDISQITRDGRRRARRAASPSRAWRRSWPTSKPPAGAAPPTSAT